MSVYKKEKADFLRISMNSIYNQTIPTNDFVLVCDGELNDELYQVIQDMKYKFKDSLHVIQLEKNMGLGAALNIGLKECKNEMVARMDSDDIARPYRCERQLDCFMKHPEITMISATVEEFTESPNHVYARRELPITHEEILKFSKLRNPFNHPCMMYKKSAVEAAGGYQSFYLLEDYYLWIRMLMLGNISKNIKEPLLWMRGGSDMYKRRGGIKYAKSQRKLIQYMHQKKFINKKQYIVSTIIRVGGALLPNIMRQKIYEKKLRNT